MEKTMRGEYEECQELSSSRRNFFFHWTNNNRVTNNGGGGEEHMDEQSRGNRRTIMMKGTAAPLASNKIHLLWTLKSSLYTAFHRSRLPSSRVFLGTIFGKRRGHVHLCFQRDPASAPAFLVELATPIRSLALEMASGQVRIALECEHKVVAVPNGKQRFHPLLLQEPKWKAYCNGKKYGSAARRECGPLEWRVLRALEAISTGAGVLPAAADVGHEGEEEEVNYYMRAKFERVTGSKDSEAFYMLNPDNTRGPPELSMYLIRV